GVVAFAAWPLLFLVVPITRRMARVSWRHLGRAAIAGLVWLALVLALGRLAAIGVWHFRIGTSNWPNRVAHGYSWGMLVAYVVVAALWWGSAVLVGWRVPDARRLIACFTLVSLLLALLSTIILTPLAVL
ncbi:MAG: hypothetical protein AAFP26_00555, partial [Planctomycetota bacterium]